MMIDCSCVRMSSRLECLTQNPEFRIQNPDYTLTAGEVDVLTETCNLCKMFVTYDTVAISEILFTFQNHKFPVQNIYLVDFTRPLIQRHQKPLSSKRARVPIKQNICFICHLFSRRFYEFCTAVLIGNHKPRLPLC